MKMFIKNSSSALTPRRVDIFSELSREVDRAVNEVFGAPFFNGLGKRGKGYPLVDAIRNKDGLTLQYTVPGVKLEDLNVTIEEDNYNEKILTVSGRLSGDYSYEEDDYQIRELSSQEFRRVVRLPQDISDQEPTSILKDGILTLHFLLKENKTKEETRKVKQLRINSM